MKKLACALAAAATLVGGSLAATSEAEARPYRYYAKPGYYGAYAYPRYRSYGAYAYPRYGYNRGYRRNAGAAVAAGTWVFGDKGRILLPFQERLPAQKVRTIAMPARKPAHLAAQLAPTCGSGFV